MFPGRFLFGSEVVWSDETGLFDKYRDSLLSSDPSTAKLYRFPLSAVYPPDMHEFFTRTVRIGENPGIPQLAQLLVHIASTCVVPKALPDALAIFALIGRRLLGDGDVGGALAGALGQLKAEKVVPGKNGIWLGLERCPMISDDRNLEKMFPEDAAVFFVDCGEKLGVGNARRTATAAHKGRSLAQCYSEIKGQLSLPSLRVRLMSSDACNYMHHEGGDHYTADQGGAWLLAAGLGP